MWNLTRGDRPSPERSWLVVSNPQPTPGVGWVGTSLGWVGTGLARRSISRHVIVAREFRGGKACELGGGKACEESTVGPMGAERFPKAFHDWPGRWDLLGGVLLGVRGVLVRGGNGNGDAGRERMCPADATGKTQCVMMGGGAYPASNRGCSLDL